jgi:ELWxxDGT repeat protein
MKAVYEPLEFRALLSTAPTVTQLSSIGALSAQQPAQFATLGNETLFTTNDPTRGQVLWQTDGTAAGTTEIAALDPSGGNSSNWANYSASYPDDSLVVGNEYYFTGLDQAHGRELWKSDGTAAGTQLVDDIVPGSGDSDPQGFVQMNGILFFGANGELWRSDGTAAGTTAIFDESPFGSATDQIAVLGNKLIFTAYDNGQSTGQIWMSDGTAAGTTRVTNLAALGSADTDPTDFTTFDNAVYFVAQNGTTGTQLWKTDGTAAGTTVVASMNYPPDSPPGVATVPDMQVAGSNLYFQSPGSASGLWVSDGTTAGTQPAAGTVAGAILAINPNGSYFEQVDDGNSVTDGNLVYDQFELDLVSPSGTSQTLATFDASLGIEAGSVLAAPNSSTNSSIYFVQTADDPGNGPVSQLWQSDGTQAGTFAISGVAPGTADPDPRPLAMVNQTLLVSPAVNDSSGNSDRQLWAVDFSGDSSTPPVVSPTPTPTPPSTPPPPPPGMPSVASKHRDNGGTFYTSTTRPTLQGTAPSGDTVTLLVDGQADGTATVAGGQYSVTCATPISNGAHVLSVELSDGSQTSTPSTDVSVDVASTPPAVRFLGLKHGVITWEFTQSMIHAASHQAIKLVLLTDKGDKHVSATYKLSYNASEGKISLTLPTGKHALPAGKYRLVLSDSILTNMVGTELTGKTEFAFDL